ALRISFFLQAEDGLRDRNVTGVQTCALPIDKTTVSEWYNGRESDIPKEYRIMNYPQPERGETERTDFDAAATMPPAAEPRPIIPLILTADNPADKMKEITDRLEQGIMGVFEKIGRATSRER